MKTCICTVIKDEQEYLKEWIEYHLQKGINHIFIFEDIDSGTHCHITKPYDDVTLLSVNDVLNGNQRKTAIQLKIDKKYNPQHLYYSVILGYIKAKQSEYDWCFIMDVDEFISSKTDIKDLLSNHTEDALVIKWKCFGANGYVKKPDYSQHGVVDIYTKEMTGVVYDIPNAQVKTCYNMRTYKNSFFYNQHIPSLGINRFDFDSDVLCLNHYITKSWEEFVTKFMLRGFIRGVARNLDFFFNINTDMLNLRTPLIHMFETEEVLVVLPYKQKGSQGTELILSLCLWQKNCTFKYHFVVIGEYDKSLESKFPWVEFIPYQSKPKIEGQYNPHLDIQNKMKYISDKYSKKYNGFIWMVDDNYAIKPFLFHDILNIHYHNLSFTGDSNATPDYWKFDKWKTRKLLDKENLPHINFTTHFPCFFEFSKLQEIWDKYNMLNESYVLEDIYFNIYRNPYEYVIKDDYIRLGIWNHEIYEKEFQKALENPNIKFMCNSVEGWSKDLENDLIKLI